MLCLVVKGPSSIWTLILSCNSRCLAINEVALVLEDFNIGCCVMALSYLSQW